MVLVITASDYGYVTLVVSNFHGVERMSVWQGWTGKKAVFLPTFHPLFPSNLSLLQVGWPTTLLELRKEDAYTLLLIFRATICSLLLFIRVVFPAIPIA